MTEEPSIRVRIDHIDWTLASPSVFDCAPPHLTYVPVLRIYGPTSQGSKACIHVHQVYRYVYVGYTHSLDPVSVRQYIATMERSLNHAISVTLKQNPNSPTPRHIRAIVLVKGVPFYGFHSSYAPFLKIYLVDPSDLIRLTTLLSSGAIMGTAFKVYEAHLSFVLQFLSDFGLYGCSWLDLANSNPLRPPPNSPSSGSASLATYPASKGSSLTLEFDVVPPEILNRRRITSPASQQNLDKDSSIFRSPEVQSLRELWDTERLRRMKLGLPPTLTPAIKFDASGNAGGQWNTTRMLWDRIYERIAREHLSRPQIESPPDDWMMWNMSTFESVQALWPNQFRTWYPTDENGDVLDATVNPYHQDTEAYLPHLPVDINQAILEAEIFDDLLKQHGESQESPEDSLSMDRDGAPDIFQVEDEPIASQIPEDVPDDEDDGNREQTRDETRSSLTLNTLASESQTKYETFDFLNHLNNRLEGYICHGIFSSASYTGSGPLGQALTSSDIHASTHPQLNSLLASSEHEMKKPNQQLTSRLENSHMSMKPQPRRRSAQPDRRGSTAHADCQANGTSVQGEDTKTVKVAERKKRPRLSVHLPNGAALFIFGTRPPSTKEILCEVQEKTKIIYYRDPFYSMPEDVPPEAQEVAGLWYDFEDIRDSKKIADWREPIVVDYDSTSEDPDGALEATVLDWEYVGNDGPPNRRQVMRWMLTRTLQRRIRLNQKRGFQNKKVETSAHREDVHLSVRMPVERRMSLMSMELLAPLKTEDNSNTEVVSLVYSFQPETSQGATFHCITGVLALGPFPRRLLNIAGISYEFPADELSLINRLAQLVMHFDPDILVGWDLKRGSWGYLAARAASYGLDFSNSISRASPSTGFPSGNEMTDNFVPVGRHVFNVWRVMRADRSLTSYSFESVSFIIMHRRYPFFDRATLTDWCRSAEPQLLQRIIYYLMDRTLGSLKILEACEIVTKVAEFARTCGIDFFSALSRGSQFKVESFMTRLAKSESFVLLSPNKSDVGSQNAAECIPLILEPRAAYYKSPVLVLDFQSLYPSMMIAYNYCYTTCVGRIQPSEGIFRLGVLGNLEQTPGLLSKLKNDLIVAPNGILYTKSSIRKGLLSRMLIDLLNTRIMLKEAMKTAGDDKDLLRILDARQISLKYVCNVTYGYTSASFSGRMPAVEIADSIVQSGRETLEKAIRLVEQRDDWGAKVIYGDTDSLFVSLPGKSKEEAFSIGELIADSVTAMNPPPVRLKFEKVYLPCMLLAKKRYVGFKLESVKQKLPTFDAKGIETVRRDGVPVQVKLIEVVLRTLFQTQDLSEIKRICFHCWGSVIDGSASLKDFIFAKEVKLGSYSDKLHPPPGAAVALRLAEQPAGQEAHFGERIPFIISQGPGGNLLCQRALSPMEFLTNRDSALDVQYYIQRVLMPPLQRILGLVGINVSEWYRDLRELVESTRPDRKEVATPQTLLDRTIPCLSCGVESLRVLCAHCQSTYVKSAYAIRSQMRATGKRFTETCLVCQSCCMVGPGSMTPCTSIECEWMFHRRRLQNNQAKLFEALDILAEPEDEANPANRF